MRSTTTGRAWKVQAKEEAYVDAVRTGLAHERVSGVGDAGRTGIGDEGEVGASDQLRDDTVPSLGRGVVVVGPQGCAHAQSFGELPGVARVFGEYGITLGEHARGSVGHVFEVTHRSRDDV